MTLDEAPLGTRRTIRRTVVATSFGFSLVQLDVTIVNVALPRIGADLGTDVAGLQWVVDAYALVFAALLLTAGFLGDRFGARRLYLGGLALFAIASLACGVANDAGALIGGRALQGIGAAAMLPSSLSLLNHASGHDAKLRAWAVGWWTAAGAITIAAGPIIGGLILGGLVFGTTSWRAIFLVNLPVCALGAALALRVPETLRGGRGRGFDPLGQILGIVALGALVASVIEAKPLGIGDPFVLGGFALALCAGVAFVLVEARVATPMLPLSLFRVPGFAVCIVYGMAANLTYYGIVFVLSLYLQRGLGYDAMRTGFAYLPLTATFFVVNVAAGLLVGRFGSGPPMVWGAIVDSLGFALLLRLGLGSPYVAMLLPFALMPAGMGTGIPAMTTSVLAGVDRAMAGTASAVLNAARQAAGAIGVALFGAFAGDGATHIVHGLHVSAALAVCLMLAVALGAAVGVPRR